MGKKDVSGFPGQTLAPALRGRHKPDDVFVEWHSDARDGGPNARAVITPDNWKLVLHDSATPSG
jgi:hypothetical protein